MKKHKLNKHLLRKFSWFIVILCLNISASVAQITVSGTVTDGNDETLVGVNITVKGTTSGTITDIDGMYTITVPDQNTILVFTYIGFKQLEKAVENNTTLNVVLEEDLKTIDELVVVAYGTQLKSHLTGAVSSLKNQKLDEVPVSRVDQALQGKLAGVQILNKDPEAGAAPTIRVRGMGSISAGKEPLVVVDGFPVPDGLSMVSMADVESIEVLKDAASSALYGSRAAGGVIMVTTKSGDIRKPKYSFKMYSGFSQALKLPDMLSTEDYVKLLYSEAALRELDPSVDGTNETLRFNLTTDNERGAYLLSKYYVDQPTDWLSEALRNQGKIDNYQLSASGGNKALTYYISGNVTTEDGIMKKSSYDKYSFKAKVDVSLTDAVKLSINLNPTYSQKETPGTKLTDYMRFPSWMPIRHNEATAALTGKIAGDYAQVNDFLGSSLNGYGLNGEVWHLAGTNPWTSGNQTPVSIRERRSFITDYYRMQNNVALSIDILPGLLFKTSNGAYFSYQEFNGKEQSEANKAGLPNILKREMRVKTELLSENTLLYTRKIGSHEFEGLLGFTMQKSSDKYNQIVGTGFPDEERLSFNMASEFLKQTSSQDGVTSYSFTESLVSLLGRLNYVYKGKYLLTASFRSDGSSKFFEGHKWGTFPSASIGWRISEEEFIKSTDVISNLKVRASYGLTGNNAIPQYAYMNTVSTIDYVTGDGTGNLVTGLSAVSGASGNPEITWEQLGETNFGLDIGLIDNRFNLAVEYYNSNTIQLLLQQPTMFITGHKSFWNNIGKVNNRGLELELTTTNINTKRFTWKTTANFSTNKNKLLNYGDKDKEDNFGERAEVYRAKVDEESIQYFGWKSDGVYTSFEEVAAAEALTDANGVPFSYTKFAPIIGGLKVVNTNGDNALDTEDRVVLGSPFPDFNWGITNSFTLGNFDLSFLFQGVQGGELINGNIYYNEQLRTNAAYLENRFVSPMFPGDGKTVYSTTTAGNQIMLTDYAIEDASYAALRDFSVGYTLPKKFVTSIGLRDIRAYFSAQNLIYIMGSNYRGVNPEARNTSSQYNNPLIDGYQRGVFPLNRTYTLGIDITF